MLTEYSSPSYSSKSNGDSLFPYQLMQRQLEGLWRQSWTVWPSELADCLKAASCVLRNQDRCGMYMLTVHTCLTWLLMMHAQPAQDARLPLCLPRSSMAPQCLMHACPNGQAMAYILSRHMAQRMPSQHSSFQGLAALPAHRLGHLHDQLVQLLRRLELCYAAGSCGHAGSTLCCNRCS